jgi:hypothetical protein
MVQVLRPHERQTIETRLYKIDNEIIDIKNEIKKGGKSINLPDVEGIGLEQDTGEVFFGKQVYIKTWVGVAPQNMFSWSCGSHFFPNEDCQVIDYGGYTRVVGSFAKLSFPVCTEGWIEKVYKDETNLVVQTGGNSSGNTSRIWVKYTK